MLKIIGIIIIIVLAYMGWKDPSFIPMIPMYIVSMVFIFYMYSLQEKILLKKELSNNEYFSVTYLSYIPQADSIFKDLPRDLLIWKDEKYLYLMDPKTHTKLHIPVVGILSYSIVGNRTVIKVGNDEKVDNDELVLDIKGYDALKSLLPHNAIE